MVGLHVADLSDPIRLMKGKWFTNGGNIIIGFLISIFTLCMLYFVGGIIVWIYRYFIPYSINYKDYQQHSLTYKKEN